MTDNTIVFPFKVPDAEDKYHEAIKWTITNTKYEIHVPELTSFELEHLLPHCLLVKNKIASVVGTAAHQGPSLYRAFPRTLSPVLQGVWQQIITDTPAGEVAETVAHFDNRIRELVAVHSTEEDQHDLLQQLRNARKPRELPVQTFFYRLRELNDCVPWLPGAAVSLPANELRQAFYDAMPQTWKDRFQQAGNSNVTMPYAQMVRYFRQQENLATKRQMENQQQQRRQSASRRRTHKGSPKDNGSRKRTRDNEPPKPKAQQAKRIPDDAPCPIHPGLDHTWGQCFSNAYNKDRPQRDNKRQKTEKVDGKVAEVQDMDTSTDAVPIQAINDLQINDDDIVCNGAFTCECFVTHELASHHLDSSSYATQMQTSEITGPSVYALQSVAAYCEELYINGDSDVYVMSNVDNVVVSSRLRAIGFMTVNEVQGHKSARPLRLLFDTGSDKTMFNFRALPKGAVPRTVEGTRINGIHGTEVMDQEVLLTGITLPEFSPTQRVPGPVRATMFKNDDTTYDVIVGMDLMQAMGIDVLCSTRTIKWNDNVIPFRPIEYLHDKSLCASQIDDDFFVSVQEEKEAARLGYKSKTILSSKYEQVDPTLVAEHQQHLTGSQRQDLARLFAKYTKLFSGKLGKYPHRKVHLEIKEGSIPTAQRPYPVAKAHMKVFKEEIDRLCSIGVLRKVGASEWLCPSFPIPKKDGRIRFISDMRSLNKVLKRKVYNLPRIQDILNRRTGHKHFTKIDISMQCHTFELDSSSQELCTICTPFGNYRYNRLPMGVSCSPDVAQEIMEDLFRSLDQTDVYIDDVGVFDDSWEKHLASLDKVLTILQDSNFTVNPLKCEWAVQETDWLGYWLTPQGLKPWRKKVDAILAIQPPKTGKQLRSFLGAVNFYRDMYPRRSHILAPLTKMSSTKGVIKWTADCQKAFNTMKALLAQEAFLSYPDHNQPFHIYADASDIQLGAAIFQNNRPVAFYSRKLNAAQRNYTVGEKELLSIVETLKEFRSMLYGCKELHVHTDHKNNTYQKLQIQSQRVARWRMFLEDFGVQYHYIKGESNHLADALSRLPFERQPPQTPSVLTPTNAFRFNP